MGPKAPDISTIPSIALQQAEVLRDGASAQYGSDAIAGVINFQLKDAREGGSLEFNTGTYRAGDGDAYQIAGNVGLPLFDTGFANLSVEYGNADPTDRSVQRADAAALIAAGNTDVADPAQIWGNPRVEDELKLFGSVGHPFSNRLELYGHANYAEKKVTEGFYFRNPNNRANVYSLDEGETLLIADLLDAQDRTVDGSANCPTVRITDNVPDPVALSQVFSNPNCFSFREIAPGGFTPRFGGVVTEMSVVSGLRRTSEDGLTWDASANYGVHESDFFIHNTVNASFGPNTPRDFDPGLYRQEDVSLTLDTSYAATELANIAVGAEWRDERFTIGGGGRPSWEVGPYAAQGFVSGSNGFPGFPDYTADTWSRSNTALYGDLELRDPGERWTVGGAFRFEHFDVFGNTTNGKLSGRYGLSDAVSIRGGISTGFRAPTPGQQNTLNVQTTIDPETLQLVDSANVPSTFRAAQLRGGQPLEPETSINTTAGVVVDTGLFTLTADYFRVDLDNRLALSQTFTLSEDERALLLSEGITSAGTLKFFRFFVNDFSSRDAGAGPCLDLQAAGARRQHAAQLHAELYPHGADGRVGAAHAGRRARPGARGAQDPLESRCRPRVRASGGAGPPELLRRLGRSLRCPLRPRDRRADLGRPLPSRPRGQHPGQLRPDARARRPERLQHLLRADGPVRGHLRTALQPVHALGPERRLLLRAPQLQLGQLVSTPEG